MPVPDYNGNIDNATGLGTQAITGIKGVAQAGVGGINQTNTTDNYQLLGLAGLLLVIGFVFVAYNYAKHHAQGKK